MFTYQVVGGTTAEITGYPLDATGPVEIPAEIDGKLVTSIGNGAFLECRGLTGVTIPQGVTSIGIYAFNLCTGLTSVNIPTGVTSIGAGAFAACTGLTSVTIPSSLTSIGGHPSDAPWGYDGAFSRCHGLTNVTLQQGLTTIGPGMFARCTALTSVTIPSSVMSIGEYAFQVCTSLTSVTIPSSVTSVGKNAFIGCSGLTKALFLGHAPGQIDGELFDSLAPGFTIYYFSGSAGFTSPTWNGYPTTMIDKTIYPAASWLLTHGLGYDTDLHQDLDGDGVSLLMAYALDLDPNGSVAGNLPAPVLNGNTLGLSFHATSPGITYRVETSIDLRTWTTDGVIQSIPGPDQGSTATVLRDSPTRFLRLVVVD